MTVNLSGTLEIKKKLSIFVQLGEELFYESKNISFAMTIQSAIAINATLCSVLFLILLTLKKLNQTL